MSNREPAIIGLALVAAGLGFAIIGIIDFVGEFAETVETPSTGSPTTTFLAAIGLVVVGILLISTTGGDRRSDEGAPTASTKETKREPDDRPGSPRNGG